MIAAVSCGEGEPTRRGRERGNRHRAAAPHENDDQGGASQQGIKLVKKRLFLPSRRSQPAEKILSIDKEI